MLFGFVCYVLVYLYGYLVDIVICLVPKCLICYFRDVVQKMERVLRMYSNLIVGEFSLYLASRFVGKFVGCGVC